MIALLTLLLLSATRVPAPAALAEHVAVPADTVPDDSLGIGRTLQFATAVVQHLRERGFQHPAGKFAFDTDSARSTVFPQVWESNVPDSAFAGFAPVVRGLLPGWPGSGPIMLSFRLDRYFVPLAFEMRFRPVLVDGAPAPVLARLPLTFFYQ
jgi:hypothetical protein